MSARATDDALDETPVSPLMTDLARRARASRLLLLPSDVRRGTASAVARALAPRARVLDLRVPALPAEWLVEEVSASLIALAEVPAAPREDVAGLIDAAAEALRAARPSVVVLREATGWLGCGGASALARWLDGTESTVFVVSGEPADCAALEPDVVSPSTLPPQGDLPLLPEDLPEDLLATLAPFACIPTPIPLEILKIADGPTAPDLGRRLEALRAVSLVDYSFCGADLVVDVEGATRAAVRASLGGRRRSITRSTLTAVSDAFWHGAPSLHTLGRARFAAQHRALLRYAWACAREEAQPGTPDLVLTLLDAMAAFGPMASQLSIAEAALERAPHADLARQLTVRRARVLRGLGRGSEALASLLSAADLDAGSPLVAGEVALALETIATPELDAGSAQSCAAKLKARLDPSVAAERALVARMSAAAAWTHGAARDAFASGLDALAALRAAGDEVGALDMLVRTLVYAVGVGDVPIALALAEQLEREGARTARAELVARARGLRGCAQLDASEPDLAADDLTYAIDRLGASGFHHFERWHRLHRGFAHAARGAIEAACADFREFDAMSSTMGLSGALGLLALRRVGSASVPAERCGDLPRWFERFAADAPRPAAGGGLAPTPPPGFYAFEIRAFDRWGRGAARAFAPHDERRTLLVGPHDEWFELRGDRRVSLRTARSLRRVFGGLVAASESGQPLDVARLFGLGWPGERAAAISIANRVYVTLCRLRAMGLKEAIVHLDAGWTLSPTIRVERARG